MSIKFSKRTSVEQVEEGEILQPKFDENGLIPVITIDNNDDQVLMHGYMNKEALKLSIETEYAVYWSRSRKKLWKKGKKVVFIKKLKEFLLTMIKIALSYLLNYKEFKLAVTLDINRVFTDKLRKKRQIFK